MYASNVINTIVLLLIVDTYLYWIHIAMHKIPFLWEIHRHHHEKYAPNFHVFEFCALWLIPMFFAWLFNMTGAMFVIAFIFVFEVGTTHKHNYSASRIHRSIFKPFRSFLGTASYHKKHHDFPNKNFTQLFTFWDILLGTKYIKIRSKNAKSNDQHRNS